MSPPPPPPPPLLLPLFAPELPPVPGEEAQPVAEAPADSGEPEIQTPGQPTDPEPAVAEPAVAEPAVAEPTVAEPAVAEQPVAPLGPAPFDEEQAPGVVPRAEAAPPSGVLAPGSRRRFFNLSAGRLFVIGEGDPEGDGYYTSYFSQLRPPLRLEGEAGIHVRNPDSSGFFVSLVLQEAFVASLGEDNSIREFGVAPRLGSDIALSNDHGVYLTPSFQFGYNLHTVREPGTSTYYGPYGPSPTDGEPSVDRTHRMDIQMGLAAKVLLADRLLLSFRPVDFQIVTDFDAWSLRWNLVGGMGLTF